MPKTTAKAAVTSKRKKQEEEEEEEERGSDEESDKQKKKKTTKPNPPQKKENNKEQTKKEDNPDELFVSLDSDYQRVTVRRWNNKLLVDIRKFYKDKSGEIKPGNKGLSLTMEQWESLKNNIDNIESIIQKMRG